MDDMGKDVWDAKLQDAGFFRHQTWPKKSSESQPKPFSSLRAPSFVQCNLLGGFRCMDWLLHPGSEGADAEHQCATTASSAGRMLHRSRFALRWQRKAQSNCWSIWFLSGLALATCARGSSKEKNDVTDAFPMIFLWCGMLLSISCFLWHEFDDITIFRSVLGRIYLALITWHRIQRLSPHFHDLLGLFIWGSDWYLCVYVRRRRY